MDIIRISYPSTEHLNIPDSNPYKASSRHKVQLHKSTHLGIPKNTALLRIDRCSRTTGDKKIYFQKRYYNPKDVSYVIELLRNDDSLLSYKDGLPLQEFSPMFAKKQ